MDLPQQVFVLKYVINLPRVEELQKISIEEKRKDNKSFLQSAKPDTGKCCIF